MNNGKQNNLTNPGKSVLGKGLASLFPGSPIQTQQNPILSPNSSALPSPVNQDEPSVSNRDRHMGISLVNIDEIRANEFQPRRSFDETAIQELSQSIRENGLIQPLIVRKNNDHYELIAGERRLRASKLAGLKTVPVVIRRSTDREALELAIVENIQREDLNCVEEGLAYFQLMQEFQLSQEELAKKMGKDRATISNALRILKLSDSILIQLKKGILTRGHAKALLSIEDFNERENLAKEMIENHLSVRQAERLVQANRQKTQERSPEPKKDTPKTDVELKRISQMLTRKLMTKINIKGDRNGEIRIHFSSPEELNRLVESLMGDQK